jgi:transcriptional regulator with XRE-family HTH domain
VSLPSSSAQQLRQALGLRLREIRVEAGLTARDLGRLMGRHSSKISRIEHGSATPSATDVRAWCEHCSAQDQTADLVASLLTVEGMFVEWHRLERTGLRQQQEAMLPLFERTRRFRAYSSWVIPGVIQTRAYTAAILDKIRRRRGLPDDVDDAVALRMDRQRILHEGDHRFALLIEESVLHAGVGGVEVMAGQLGHLIGVSSLPNVSLGIVPMRPDRDAWPIGELRPDRSR